MVIAAFLYFNKVITPPNVPICVLAPYIAGEPLHVREPSPAKASGFLPGLLMMDNTSGTKSRDSDITFSHPVFNHSARFHCTHAAPISNKPHWNNHTFRGDTPPMGIPYPE
jgi:hypothetical protein